MRCAHFSIEQKSNKNRFSMPLDVLMSSATAPTAYAVSYTYNGVEMTNRYTYDEASDEFWADDSLSRIGYHKDRKRYVMYEANGETAP